MNLESTKSKSQTWQFKVDVGGTFTDYIAVDPEGAVHTGKILSSGCLRSNFSRTAELEITDSSMAEFRENLFKGFKVRLPGDDAVYTVRSSKNGVFKLLGDSEIPQEGKYELYTGEEAPVIVMRLKTSTSLFDAFPEIHLNLGTTRGTNALLERKGSKVGLICNKGFKDVWDIGTQARSRLFDLNIRKPDSLIASVYEISGRLDAEGNELEEMSEEEIRKAVLHFKENGIESVAICLINSYVNTSHEVFVRSHLGDHFTYVAVSHEVTRTIKLLERGDTTLVDAYLSPVINEYISSIIAAVPGLKIRLMTSAGGLVSPENFSGKDSLLSGPAGGVNGFSHAAVKAGFNKAVGFDMGGTSTDVKRYGGEFEYQYETVKAGVRVVAPMFAIETVAAGGGSICSYDDQRFLVGPESAGASPGPACYGAGGPLTVTDINLFNGRIDPAAFPFRLDLKTVEVRLLEISEKVRQSEGRLMTAHEIADGFSRIADFKMAEAVKEISSAKGYDPADHVLVAFGGAGPQHACSIAELLGMKTVLVHPYSGILSAFGIGLTGVQLFEELSVIREYSSDKDFLEAEITQLKEILTGRLSSDCAESEIQFSVRLDLRYEGEIEAISVPFKNALEIFEDKHRQFFAHIHENRKVEVLNLRVKALVKEELPDTKAEIKSAASSAATEQDLWIRGKRFRTALVDRIDLQPGFRRQGPLIIREGLSTVVVEDGWSVEVSENLDLIIRKTGQLTHSIIDGGREKDPVKLELFNNLFTSIASRMGETLRRISLSVNIKERLDFSCALLNAKGDLIINAPHIPVHLGAVSDSVKALLREVKSLEPGMVFLTNDPSAGGSHLPDLTVISPVFDTDGKLLFFTASRAHHAEIGGLKPGSFCPFAKSLDEEGVVFRNFLLADKNGFREKELLRHLSSAAYPSRAPLENIADLKAALAAGRYGENELLAVIDEFGKDLVLAYMEFMCVSAAERTGGLIENLQIAEGSFVDCFDDGTPLAVKVTKIQNRLKIDFAGTGPVSELTMNANKSIVKSSVLFVLRCLLNEEIPLNEGVLRNVDIEIPNCLLNPPEKIPRSAVSAGNVEVSQKICDVLFAALGICASSQGTMNNIIFGNDSFGFYETLGGGAGASGAFSGASGVHTNMTNTRLTDIEVIEKFFPVRIQAFGYHENSGGQGLNCGGNGLSRTYLFTEDLELSLVTQRRNTSAFGLKGGENGRPGKNLLYTNGGKTVAVLDSLSHKSVFKGDLLEILTPGGGGWGEKSS